MGISNGTAVFMVLDHYLDNKEWHLDYNWYSMCYFYDLSLAYMLLTVDNLLFMFGIN